MPRGCPSLLPCCYWIATFVPLSDRSSVTLCARTSCEAFSMCMRERMRPLMFSSAGAGGRSGAKGLSEGSLMESRPVGGVGMWLVGPWHSYRWGETITELSSRPQAPRPLVTEFGPRCGPQMPRPQLLRVVGNIPAGAWPAGLHLDGGPCLPCHSSKGCPVLGP